MATTIYPHLHHQPLRLAVAHEPVAGIVIPEPVDDIVVGSVLAVRAVAPQVVLRFLIFLAGKGVLVLLPPRVNERLRRLT